MADKKLNESKEIRETIDGEDYVGYETNLNSLTKDVTERGFGRWEFTDLYGLECSLQDSSMAGEASIWFGIDDAKPMIMASKTEQGGTGWVDYPIPDDVLLHTRMHLSQTQVKALLPILTHFAETGEYVRDFEDGRDTVTEEAEAQSGD